MRKLFGIIFLLLALFSSVNLVHARRYYDAAIGRWLTPDPALQEREPQWLAENGYYAVSPFVYCFNNPLLFIDANGDTISISDEMANSEALANFASTEEGRKYLSQFAYAGQTITINGKDFTFEKAGKSSAHNLNFIGYTNKADGITQISTSVGGLELNNYLGVDGVHNYNISIGSNMSLGSQMDAIFHEVQHSSMFEQGQFRGMINSKIEMLHHGAMMQSPLWTSHERFINQANNMFNAGINASRVYGGVGISGGLYRHLQGQFGLQILNRMNQYKRIPY